MRTVCRAFLIFSLRAFSRQRLGGRAEFRVGLRPLKTGLNLVLLISLGLSGSEFPGFKPEAAASSQRQLEVASPGQDWPKILERVRTNALA